MAVRSRAVNNHGRTVPAGSPARHRPRPSAVGILSPQTGMCGLRQGPESLGVAFRRRSQVAPVQAFLVGRVEAPSGGPRFFPYPANRLAELHSLCGSHRPAPFRRNRAAFSGFRSGALVIDLGIIHCTLTRGGPNGDSRVKRQPRVASESSILPSWVVSKRVSAFLEDGSLECSSGRPGCLVGRLRRHGSQPPYERRIGRRESALWR